MIKNRALMYVVCVMAVSMLYSAVYFFIPLKEMGNICLIQAPVDGGTICAVNLALVFMSIYMIIPFITAFVLQKLVYKEKLADIGFRFKWSYWLIAALFIPIAVSYASILPALLMPGVSFTPDMSGMFERFADTMQPEQIELMKEQTKDMGLVLFAAGIFQMIAAALTINALFALGEEAGWRGFLLKNLEKSGFYKKSLIIGAVWGIWHFPVVIQGYNYPEHPAAGVVMMILFCVLYSPLLVYIAEKTGSVFYAAVMHGSINASAGAAIMFISGGSDIMVGLMGASGLSVILAANIVLALYDRYIAKEKVIFSGRI
ncbi:MAG: CPBP family intramembrane glutamic endopeptidase [Candidatus Goldiibacteriota bacterium]